MILTSNVFSYSSTELSQSHNCVYQWNNHIRIVWIRIEWNKRNSYFCNLYILKVVKPKKLWWKVTDNQSLPGNLVMSGVVLKAPLNPTIQSIYLKNWRNTGVDKDRKWRGEWGWFEKSYQKYRKVVTNNKNKFAKLMKGISRCGRPTWENIIFWTRTMMLSWSTFLWNQTKELT